MASTYSDLKFELIGTGDQSGVWGTTTNNNIGDAIEQALVGLGNPIFTTDANLTITLTNTVALQTARALVLNATSTGSLTATRELVVPTIEKQYIVQNNTTGGQSITVKTTAGTGITVPTGRKAHLYVDGVNVIQMFDFVDINGGAVDGTPVGATTASTGAFTTLTTSSTVTHNGGTANGVAFLNASKVLTTGSALTFDGTNFGNTRSVATAFSGANSATWANGIVLTNTATPATGVSNLLVFQGTSNVNSVFGVTQGTSGFGDFVWAGYSGSFSEQMRLTPIGLGIGTSSPATKLEVSVALGTSTYSEVARFVNTSLNSGAKITFFGKQGSDASAKLSGAIGFNQTVNSDSNGQPAFIIETGNNGSITERARIDSSGNLLVGTTSGSFHKFHKSSASDFAVQSANTSASTPFGHVITFTAAAPNDATSMFLRCDDTGFTGRIQLRSNGGIANFSGNNVNLSDRREKTNFAPATSYLDKICAIPVQTFNYIDQNLEDDDGLTLGVVAQDVQAVAPELVMESNWGSKEEPKQRLSIYQTDLQYALMKCIQEQQALITALTARITALESN